MFLKHYFSKISMISRLSRKNPRAQILSVPMSAEELSNSCQKQFCYVVSRISFYHTVLLLVTSRSLSPLLLYSLRVANVYGAGSAMATNQLCRGGRMKYLTQAEAASLDQELFNEYKFSVDQLMELAGLSVAVAVAKTYPPFSFNKALVVCGPGNNGGDGLVAARHMVMFGYNVAIYYPKRTAKPLYENLLEQCKRFGVSIVEELPPSKDLKAEYNVLVDSLFGFSFKPPVRDELKPALDALIDGGVPVCSVDIPSGWDVEKGPSGQRALRPSMLISLSAPKLCARPELLDNAQHFLGGRFLPPGIVSKYNLTLPAYPDQDQVVQLSC